MGERQWFVLYMLVCLEVGIFLLLVPWSVIWERNYFLQAYPILRPWLLDPSVRGAVSGLGAADISLVLFEVLARRRRSEVPAELFPGGIRLAADPGRPGDPSSKSASSLPENATESRALVAHEKGP